jgi:hypothetical protein
LAGETYLAVRQWLDKQHAIKPSSSTIGRYGKATRDRFSALVVMGMPIKEIIKHRQQIEVLGIESVRQQLLAKLTEKNGPLFAYLDDREVQQ